MADPIKVLQSLAPPLASQYAVFERDQVLTHTQLNGVSRWLDQQDRLSRVCLVGTGVIGGFQVSSDASSVSISPGLGITCDGDLIRIEQRLTLTRLRPYDQTAPRYDPFFDPSSGIGLISDELVGDDDPLGRPIADQSDGIADRIVLLLMESSESDPDLCTGADCDNLGRDRQHRLRVLLAPVSSGTVLTAGPTTSADRARNLPELMAYRPKIDSGLTTAEALATRYRDTCKLTLKALDAALQQLGAWFPELVTEPLGTLPFGDWMSTLGKHLDQTSNGRVQLGFDLLKDLVATWNELREALLDDDAVLLPSIGTFPKHLGIGNTGNTGNTGGSGNPATGRTGFFPAATDARAREAGANARFLLRRLGAQIEQFAVPTDTLLHVTPSQGDDRPLGERAIPWYYTPGMHNVWNRRLSARGLGGHNLGYRASADGATQRYPSSPRAGNPLAGTISGHAFFRVEGHLGRPVDEVSAELKKLVTEHNLPFEVHAVLAHNRKERIKIRPAIRYTDLHRFHYLLRQDVSLRLDESSSFADKYIGTLKTAVEKQDIPAQTDDGISVLGTATTARSAVSSLTSKAKPALDKQTYSAYRRSTEETRWNNGLAETLGSIGTARVNLGTLSRSDFVSPLDSLIQTTHPVWLDWLDDLIKAKDDKADDKLLLSAFVTQHPGLDHLGGAWRGGTFVLVYDDAEKVIADFTLAYPCAEADEPEPVEPPLQRPPMRRPPLDIDPIKVIRPIDLKIDTLVGKVVGAKFDTAKLELDASFKAVQTDIKARLDNQTASVEGLVKGAFSTRDATAAGVVLPGKVVATGDALLDELVKDVEYKRQKVQSLVELTSRGDLSDDSRTQAQALLVKAQAELGESVATTTERVVTQKVDTSTGSAAGVASVLATGAVMVTDTAAAATLGSRLDTLKTGTTALAGTQLSLLNNLQTVARLKK